MKQSAKTIVLAAMITAGTVAATPALAQVDAQTAAELRARIEALSARLEELERQSAAQPEPERERWSDRIEISGDLRPRYEYIDDETRPDSRNRERLRARLALSARLNDNWSADVGLATGGDDPVSTNQTLGNAGSTKDIRLDYAYFRYSGLDNLIVYGGKYENVFNRTSNLLFDGDYRPEGAAVRYAAGEMTVNAGAMILESDELSSGTGQTDTLWGAQLGYTPDLAGNAPLTVGAGYFHAPVKGNRPYYTNFPAGNSVNNNNTYLSDYRELELFGEYRLAAGPGTVSLFGHYVNNLDAADNDTGWSIGAGLRLSPWELAYSYRDLEADAVLGTLTDSDFGGGGTGARGHIIEGALAIAANTELGFTWFFNELRPLETDYERFQFDLSMSF